VRTIAVNLPGGSHVVTWDGLDSNDRRTAAGIYLIRVVADGEQWRGKAVRSH